MRIFALRKGLASLPRAVEPWASSFSGSEFVKSGVVNRRKLIRELARDAKVSRAEAADAVDELGHRLLQAVKRLTEPAVTVAACSGRKEKRQTIPKARRKEVSGDQSR